MPTILCFRLASEKYGLEGPSVCSIKGENAGGIYLLTPFFFYSSILNSILFFLTYFQEPALGVVPCSVQQS